MKYLLALTLLSLPLHSSHAIYRPDVQTPSAIAQMEVVKAEGLLRDVIAANITKGNLARNDVFTVNLRFADDSQETISLTVTSTRTTRCGSTSYRATSLLNTGSDFSVGLPEYAMTLTEQNTYTTVPQSRCARQPSRTGLRWDAEIFYYNATAVQSSVTLKGDARAVMTIQ